MANYYAILRKRIAWCMVCTACGYPYFADMMRAWTTKTTRVHHDSPSSLSSFPPVPGKTITDRAHSRRDEKRRSDDKTGGLLLRRMPPAWSVYMTSMLFPVVSIDRFFVMRHGAAEIAPSKNMNIHLSNAIRTGKHGRCIDRPRPVRLPSSNERVIHTHFVS